MVLVVAVDAALDAAADDGDGDRGGGSGGGGGGAWCDGDGRLKAKDNSAAGDVARSDLDGLVVRWEWGAGTQWSSAMCTYGGRRPEDVGAVEMADGSFNGGEAADDDDEEDGAGGGGGPAL